VSIASIGVWVLIGPWLMSGAFRGEWGMSSEITPPPNKKHKDRDKIRQIAVIAMV
jgi:hypothetical protein